MPTECSATLFEFARVEGRSVVGAFDGGKITSDAGALLLAATDRAVGLIDRFAGCFTDSRSPELVEHTVATLVGQRIFGIALGYEDVLDHDDLRYDPMMAVLAGKLAARRKNCAPVAGKSTLNRLELGKPERTPYHKIGHDPQAIENLLIDLFVEAHARSPRQIILDLDATGDPLHGHQEGRFFHGYYDCYCYLPLYIFCDRHLLAAKLRRSNIDASAGAVEEVARIVGHIRSRWPRVRILLRGDAGFAREDLMHWCELNSVDFLFGLAKNVRLTAEIAAELAAARQHSEQTGKPARRFKDFTWSTLDSWSRTRRVVGKAEWTGGEATRALSSPRWLAASMRPVTSTRRFIAHAARWKTASKNANSTCLPTAPPPRPCAPTSCGYGSRRWRMCWSAPCARLPCGTRSLQRRPAVRSASSCSRLARWCGSASAASRSRWPPPVPTKTSSPSPICA